MRYTAVVMMIFGLAATLPQPVVAQSAAISGGWLGAELTTVPAQVARLLPEDDRGLWVAGITAGGPAETAGIRPGDILVQAGTTRLGAKADMDELLRIGRPGSILQIELLRPPAKGDRGIQRRLLNVVLGTPPAMTNDSPGALMEAAVDAMNRKDFRQAEALLSRAIDGYDGAEDRKARLLVMRGMTLAMQGKHDVAMADFDLALRLNPQDDRAYYARGLSHGSRNKFNQALTDFDTAIRLNPANPWALFYRGVTYARLRNSDAALKDLEAANRLLPENAKIDRALDRVRKGELPE